MEAVYVGGTAMTVKGSSDVPVGVVNVIQRDAFSNCQQYLIPRHLQPGEWVTWRPDSGSPLARWIIHGHVEEMRSGTLILRVYRVAGPHTSGRPLINDLLDTCVAPGTMQRWYGLDIKYDGRSLGDLLTMQMNEDQARCGLAMASPLTPAQRAAVSFYWSAELRRRIASHPAFEAERWRADEQHTKRIMVDIDW
jgi:hypothetical protein